MPAYSTPALSQVEPGYARARIRLATCHMRLGRFPQALAALEQGARPFEEPVQARERAGKRAEVEALQARYTQVRPLRAPGTYQGQLAGVLLLVSAGWRLHLPEEGIKQSLRGPSRDHGA